MKTNIINIIIILSQSIAGIFVLLRLQNVKLKIFFKEFLISLIIFIVLMMFSNYLVPNQIRSLFTLLSFTSISFFIFKNNMKESFLNGLISIAFVAIVEIIFSFLMFLFGLNQSDLMNVTTWKFILNILISIFLMLSINLKFLYNFIAKFKLEMMNRKKLFSCFLIILILIYLIVARNALFAKVTLDMIINLIILFIFIIMFIIIILSDNKNKYLEETNQQMLNYVTKYEKIITEQGKANHEFKNQLMVIKGYAQMGSKKLIDYIDSITQDANKTHSSYLISQLNKFPEGGIKGLLYYKLSTMEEQKIKYELDVEAGIKTKLNVLSVNMYKNITKILGVMLDNAIEASKKSKKKLIIISVVKIKSSVVFSISNTYSGKIDLSKLGSGYTSKGFGHGYGLRLVNDILNETNSFIIKNDVVNGYFVSELTVKIRRKKKK